MPHQPPSSQRKNSNDKIIFAVIIVITGVTVYANSLQGPFIYDDLTAIVNNPHIRNLWPPNWLTEAWHPSNAIHSRFVVGFSFAVNYAADGLNPTGYHLVNISTHIFCALLLMSVIRRTLQLNPQVSQFTDHTRGIAFTIAIIWLVHPLQTETVNYILQRTESFMALFYLLTFYCFLRGLSGSNGSRWFVAAVIACALGMGSKETMASAPFMLLLYDRIFVSKSWGEIRKRWLFYAGLASSWVLLVILIWRSPHGNTVSATTDIGPWEYLLNQCTIIPRYLKLAVWPDDLNIDYGFPVSSLSTNDVFVSAILLILLFGLTIVAIFKVPKIGFLGLTFFVLLAPTSSILPILTEVGAERRMYLPLAALISLFATSAYWTIFTLTHKSGSTNLRRALFVSTVLILGINLGLSLRTIARNNDFTDPIHLWQTSVEILPTNPRAHNNLGIALGNRELIDESLVHFRIAAESSHYPSSLASEYRSQAYKNLGVALLSTMELNEAIVAFQESITLQPDNADAQFHLGLSFARKGDFNKAIPYFHSALQSTPHNPTISYYLGLALWESNRPSEAARLFERAIEIHPTYREARESLNAVRRILAQPPSTE